MVASIRSREIGHTDTHNFGPSCLDSSQQASECVAQHQAEQQSSPIDIDIDVLKPNCHFNNNNNNNQRKKSKKTKKKNKKNEKMISKEMKNSRGISSSVNNNN